MLNYCVFLSLDGPIEDQKEEENPILTTDWWGEYVKPEDQEKVELGAKLELLFEILAMCEEIGDKVWVGISIHVGILIFSLKPFPCTSM